MNRNIIIYYSVFALGLTLISLAMPEGALAQTTACYGNLENDPKPLVEFVTCFLPKLWTTIQALMIGIAIIILMWRVVHFLINRENPKALEGIPTQWMYTLAFLLIAFGAGGTLLNMLLKFLKLGTIGNWLAGVTDVLNWLKTFE